jgi:hypothetical protein
MNEVYKNRATYFLNEARALLILDKKDSALWAAKNAAYNLRSAGADDSVVLELMKRAYA